MFPQLNIQPFGELSTVQLLPLGTVMYNPKDQGRTAYRYVQFGGTATIAAGLLLVAPAAPANSTGLALNTANSTAQLTAKNPASNQLVITNGATAVTANQFADGEIMISGSGVVERHRITGNSADSVGAAAITVEYFGFLNNTLTIGTQTVSLRQSPAYNPNASLTQALPVGVTQMSVANTASVTNYGWVQIAGTAFVQCTSATKGYPLVQDTSGTAGYLANTASNLSQIGIAQESASSSLAPVFLQLN
jgi:hypothetical protein